MTRAELFDFEGQQMTATQVNAIVTCLSRPAVVVGLRAGRNTRALLTQYNGKTASVAATRKHIKANPLPSYKGMTRWGF